MDRDEIDQRMAEADLELQQMAYEALNRCYSAGAKVDDLKFIGWLAGCSEWKPQQRKAA